MTDVRLVQLVDAADVAADGTLVYDAPWDRPYDWTVSGDPKLLARTFGFFATDKGLAEIATYAHGIGPWKRYIVSTRVAANGALVTLPPTDLIKRDTQGPAHPHVDVPRRAEQLRLRLRRKPAAGTTASSSSSGSTACSRTSPSPPCWRGSGTSTEPGPTDSRGASPPWPFARADRPRPRVTRHEATRPIVFSAHGAEASTDDRWIRTRPHRPAVAHTGHSPSSARPAGRGGAGCRPRRSRPRHGGRGWRRCR